MRRFRPHSAHIFVFPYVVFLVLFGIGPGLYSLLLMFSSFKGGRPDFFTAELQNITTLIKDFRFADSFLHVFQYLLVSRRR